MKTQGIEPGPRGIRWAFSVLLLGSVIFLAGCQEAMKGEILENRFDQDVAFMQQHTDAFVLGKGLGKVLVVPQYQGRVMTSTSGGDKGASYGWINYELVERGVVPYEQRKNELTAHIHVFGGEDRFWLGPEGGQYAIFFQPGTDFVFDDWFTPAPIDTEPFEVVTQSDDSALFHKNMELVNYSGSQFKLRADREVRLLDRKQVSNLLKVDVPPAVKMVAYETDNRITNTGLEAWTKEDGLLSIWILGMFKPSPSTTIVIPIESGSKERLGPKVNDDYFGKVPPERLTVREDVIFFLGDGNYRSKIGILPQRSRGIAASYDVAKQVLTIVMYNEPARYVGYVNSLWQWQDDPYGGDAINSYNDGPVGDSGEQLGPFYELETSSPAADLQPGQSMRHIHTTIHLEGNEIRLNPICRKVLGVSLARIKRAFD